MKTKTNRAILTTLRNPTANELNGAFAHHIANFKHVGLEWRSGPKYWRYVRPACDGDGRMMDRVPNYCGNFGEVIPWLERSTVQFKRTIGSEWSVLVGRHGLARHRSLPRAAVIALLRNAGITITP